MSDKPSRFEVRHKVAEGRTVLVQRAFDHELKRDVAMKTLRDDHATFPERVASFSASSKLAARVQHATLVPVVAARRVGSRIYTISPWVQGLKLWDIPRPLEISTVAGVIAQLAEGMSAAHSLGIVLRGLHPKDIFLRADGQLLLLDLNKLQEPGEGGPLPPAHVRAEVLRYLPMEARSNGLIDGQTDIFCLGALALELLTGVAPTAEGAVDMKPALISALTSAGPVGQFAKLAMTLASPRPDQRPTSVNNVPTQLQPLWEQKGFTTSKASVAAALRGVPGFAAPRSVPPAPAPAVSRPPPPPPPRAPSPGYTPHDSGSSFEDERPPAQPSGSRSGAQPPRPRVTPPAMPSAARPVAPARPKAPPPVMQPAPEEDELLHFFEETTTSLERQLVKDALATAAEVAQPKNDPWGLRSQNRFRSLEEDMPSEDGGASSSEVANASGFSFVNESGKVQMGQPPRTPATGRVTSGARPVTTSRPPPPKPPQDTLDDDWNTPTPPPEK